MADLNGDGVCDILGNDASFNPAVLYADRSRVVPPSATIIAADSQLDIGVDTPRLEVLATELDGDGDFDLAIARRVASPILSV